MRMTKLPVFTLLIFIVSCVGESPSPQEESKPSIDARSYKLGAIGAFSEVVAVGVKKLALSSPMTREEMDGLMVDAERIAQKNGVKLYRDEDFLVTDLFPESLTSGKHVLLIYLDPVKDAYMALKEKKKSLIERGEYEGEARKEIAREMGRLLSYPEERIEQMLSPRVP